MAGNLYDLIPGLRESDDRYRSEAAEAFAGVEPMICGAIEILPLTPRMFLDLEGGECSFVARTGREIDFRDVGLLLWRCSPMYKPRDADLQRLFQATLAALPFADARDEIAEYLRRSLAGMPLWKGKVGGSPGGGVAVWASRLVHLFAKEYGWTESAVLEMPFRRLWQYANRILEGADPSYKEQCPESLEIRAKFLQRLNAGVPPGAN